MANDGQIVFEVTADGSRARADIRNLTNDIQRETREWDNAAQQAADNMGDSFSSMLKKVTSAIGAAKIGQTLLNFGKDALSAASDLEEVQNVVDVTFGDSAHVVDAWAKQAVTAFGLTEAQAKRFASTLGAMMKSSGMSGDEITQMSTDLAGLAADMASFYNLDFDTAFQKISSGISGETQPLKQLGINMSVANLNAFALEKGLEKTFEQMDSGEQTMLRYQYLMAATADAQGDFSRTSDGYANSIRKLENVFEGIKASIGNMLIGDAAETINKLTAFLEMLFPESPPPTVLDTFASIDADLSTQLADIEHTASAANALNEQLTKINETKVDKVAGNIEKLATDLAGINFEEGKAGAVSQFIATLADNIGIVAAIRGESAEGAAQWLTTISDAANKLEPDDAAGWTSLIEQIRTGLPGIENTEFGDKFFSSLSSEYQTLNSKATLYEWAVDSLGSKTERTAEEQRIWLEVCKRLVQTIPGLSEIINTETGEIEGGTVAVKNYIDAWENGQKRLALMSAQDKRRAALEQKYAELPGLEIDMLVAEDALKDKTKKIYDLYAKYKLDPERIRKMYGLSDDADVYSNSFGNYESVYGQMMAEEFGLTKEQFDELNAVAGEYRAAVDEARRTADEYTRQLDAYNKAQEIIAKADQVINDKYGDQSSAIAGAASAIAGWSEEMKEAATSALDVAGSAISDLNDYIDKFREKVGDAVSSVADGFKMVTRPTKEYTEKIDELNKKLQDPKTTKAEKEKIEKEIESLNKELEQYKPKGMEDALTSQSAFLDQYLQNLKKVRSYGVSDAFLAMLSDGSVESAEYLDALAKDKEAALALDQQWQDVQAKKQELTSALTEQQLTVDEVYQRMLEDAKAAVAGLDLEEDAKNNSGKTVAGLAQGIGEKLPEVQTQVDAILAELGRLNGWGFNINLNSVYRKPVSYGGVANRQGNKPTGNVLPYAGGGGYYSGGADGDHAAGLNFVPFDGYLASLHAGEGILTAEENRVWQRFKNGGAGIDYDTMGGVMRDNIKPGGNVYLNGRVVGSVISDQQGASYRQMKRSGFQA